MSGYSTYVVGKDAILFAAELLNNLHDSNMWWRMSYRYESFWRNLHIDGFEGYIFNRHELPKHQNRTLSFFQYAPKKVSPSDCLCPTVMNGPEYSLEIQPNCPWHNHVHPKRICMCNFSPQPGRKRHNPECPLALHGVKR